MKFTKQVKHKIEMQEQKKYPRFISEVHRHFVLWVPDEHIEFSGTRHPESYHDSGRPTAVTKRKPLSATFVPKTTRRRIRENKKNINNAKCPYSVWVESGEIQGLAKGGWFLTRYPQKEPAERLETMGIQGGSKIPAQIFNEILKKMEMYIDYCAGQI